MFSRIAALRIIIRTQSLIYKQGDGINKVIRQIENQNVRTLSLMQGHDATPGDFAFGAHSAELIPIGRYLHLKEDGKWELLNAEQYKTVSGRGTPSHGVLEIFLQRMTVHYRLGNVVHHRSILVMPRVLPDQTASSIFSACETGIPEFRMEALNGLCGHLKYLLYTETPDGASAAERKGFGTANFLERIANAFYILLACVVHSVHRIVVSIVKEEKIIGDIYAAKYVSHLGTHFARLYRVLHQIVFRELEFVDRNLIDDAEFERWRQHVEDVLEHTFMRRQTCVRARAAGDDTLSDGAQYERLSKIKKKVAILVNGDITRPRCTIVVTTQLKEMFGEAYTEDAVREALVECLISLNVLLGSGSRLPCKSRWGTLTESNSEMATGTMVYHIYPRVFQAAFPDWKSGSI